MSFSHVYNILPISEVLACPAYCLTATVLPAQWLCLCYKTLCSCGSIPQHLDDEKSLKFLCVYSENSWRIFSQIGKFISKLGPLYFQESLLRIVKVIYIS